MNASTPAASSVIATPARGPSGTIPDQAVASAQDEADTWIGYESFHPLTWLPAPGVPQPGID